MEPQVSKVDNKLAVQETVSTEYSLDDLLAQQETITNDIAAMDAHYQDMSAIKADQLARVNDLISQAQGLGLVSEVAQVAAEEVSKE